MSTAGINSLNSANANLTISSTAGNLLVDKIFVEPSPPTPSPIAGQTPIFFENVSTTDFTSSFTIAVDGNNNMGYNSSANSSVYNLGVAEFAAASTNPATIPTMSQWGFFLFGVVMFTLGIFV